MRDPFVNPFAPTDLARHTIWQMLVPRDIDAFLAADWSLVEPDFIAEGFVGINGHHNANPARWRLTFPTLEAYRDEWLQQASEFAEESFAEDPRAAIFSATTLNEIEIAGEAALARKKFYGRIRKADDSFIELKWQTLYTCRVHDGRWKIAGFTGYLPYPMG